MPARPRPPTRESSRRISSTIRKLDKNVKGNSPLSRTTSRIRSNPPRRRTRSPRLRTKPLARSPPKRRLSLSPKHTLRRKSREDMRVPPKRTRDLSKNRSKSPRQIPHTLPQRRPLSRERERIHPYSESNDSSIRKFKNIVPEKLFNDKTGSELPINREELKNIKKRISGNVPGNSSEINRRIIHPEDITLPRRPGEGSTPIFDRQEIIENRRKYPEEDMLGPSSDRAHYEPSTSCSESFRPRDFYHEKERERNASGSRRSPQEYEFKAREDLRYRPPSRSRRSRSFDKLKYHSSERKDHYEERDIYRPRRSLDRERDRDRDRDRDRERERERDRERERERERDCRRSSDRYGDSYREEYEDRGRSPERRDYSRTYYEVDEHENRSSSSTSRGRGYRRGGRGGGRTGASAPGRPVFRNAGFVVRQVPPVRILHGAPIPRLAVPGRGMPFPPRFLRPVIQYLAPFRPSLM